MKILCITANLGSGGAERQLCGLAIELKKKGYDVKVAYYINKTFYKPLLDEAGITSEYIPQLSGKFLRPVHLAKKIKKDKINCVISYLSSVNMAACLAKILHPFKLIVSERNTHQKVSFHDKVLFNLYRVADYVVPNSYSEGDFISNNFPFLQNKTCTIINMIDTKKFIPANHELPKRDKLQIVTVGRYTPQKNCLWYLDAIKLCKERKLNVHFNWYGNKQYNEGYFNSILNKIQELDISDMITLHDYSSNVVEVYQNADVFCLPSLYEGCPNVICEAMSCGLPILCSSVCDNPRIVQSAINGYLFNPKDSHSFCNALQELLAISAEELNVMKKTNRTKISKELSAENFVNNYINLINSFV